jgi:UDP-N-acetylmuramate--alanine ligase
VVHVRGTVAGSSPPVPVASTIKRGEMVGLLQQGKQVIAVAGAAADHDVLLIAYMLSRAASADLHGWRHHPRPAQTPSPATAPFVVEADEYDRAFLNYRPYIAVVTNIGDRGHPTMEDLQAAFARFLSQVDNSGLSSCTDSPVEQSFRL